MSDLWNHSLPREIPFLFAGTTSADTSLFLGGSTADAGITFPRWPMHGGCPLVMSLRIYLAAATWSGGGNFTMDIVKGTTTVVTSAITFASGASGRFNSALSTVTWATTDDVAIRLVGPGIEVAATIALSGSLFMWAH